jgi:hypothetical protein
MKKYFDENKDPKSIDWLIKARASYLPEIQRDVGGFTTLYEALTTGHLSELMQ